MIYERCFLSLVSVSSSDNSVDLSSKNSAFRESNFTITRFASQRFLIWVLHCYELRATTSPFFCIFFSTNLGHIAFILCFFFCCTFSLLNQWWVTLPCFFNHYLGCKILPNLDLLTDRYAVSLQERALWFHSSSWKKTWNPFYARNQGGLQ